jgi:surface polysaccharide O-acyltransferase-like enzyme
VVTPGRRSFEVDLLKSIGIVTVVLIHSMRDPWDPAVSQIELLLGQLTRFAVPSFFLASGFLYATSDPVPARRTFARMRRLLPPYLIASCLAQLWWVGQGTPHPPATVLRDFLIGNSFAIYYYVFVIFVLALLAPLLARLPHAALLAFTGVLLVSQGAAEMGAVALPWDWHMRSPFTWWAYFCLGWLARLHEGQIRSSLRSRRALMAGILAVTLAAVSIAVVTGVEMPARRALSWLNLLMTLVFLFALGAGRDASPRWARFLSDATYPVYLLHLFFIYATRLWLAADPQHTDLAFVLLPWIAGLVGSFAVVMLGRLVLRDRSRFWIGA